MYNLPNAEKIVLSVGDTTYLDYGSIKAKREGYEPTGNGGNGLILHSAKRDRTQLLIKINTLNCTVLLYSNASTVTRPPSIVRIRSS